MSTQPAPPAAIATLRTALDKATLVDDNPAYILGKLLGALSRDGWQITPADANPEPTTQPLDLSDIKVRRAFRATLEDFIADLDYDIHKNIERGEEDGLNRYEETTATFIGLLQHHITHPTTATTTATEEA
ncbi:hypothetical protein ACIRRH_41255 [Kitasatospora sp. NPDC101235]|uniref:hypothetical protein n=1 Tax=Kitasatospora sp. NPDC101235 TaxID=3364101 RepID=UPI0037F8237B